MTVGRDEILVTSETTGSEHNSRDMNTCWGQTQSVHFLKSNKLKTQLGLKRIKQKFKMIIAGVLTN